MSKSTGYSKKGPSKIFLDIRRISPLFILFGVVALTGIVFAATSSPEETQKNKRPNIIVIMTDDQDEASVNVVRPDTGTYAFPNMRWIAEEGVRFENSYTSHGLCCPSRATLLSGQYDHNHGVLTNQGANGGFAALDHTNTLPVWLKNAGYTTFQLGKYMNGYTMGTVPPGWTKLFAIQNSGQNFNFKVTKETGEIVQFGNTNAEFQADVLARRVARFIANRESGNSPFFIWLNFTAPHVGNPSVNGDPNSTAVPAPRHLGIFNGYQPVWPPSFNEADVSDKPHYVSLLPPIQPFAEQLLKTLMRARLESLLSVDEAIGTIREALSRTGQLDDTVIIFTSDNGYQQGEHRIKTGKNQQYDESISVPLFMRGPGIPNGVVIPKLAVNVDYAPTIIDLAGATPGRVMDGRSLMSIIEDPSAPWREYFLVENLASDIAGANFIGAHGENEVYIEHEYMSLPDTVGPDDTEFYVDDPYQLNSKHADPAYAPTISHLKNVLNVLKTCSGATCWQ